VKILCLPAIETIGAGLSAHIEVSGDLLSNLKQLELTITSDYYSGFRRSISEAIQVSAEEYLYGNQEIWTDNSLLCPEMVISRRWITSLRLVLPQGTAFSAQAVAFMHAGRAHCMAPIHFDWYHSWVAHACLTGRKRFFFVPPQEGWLLQPIINTSALCVPRLPAADRQELLGHLDGCEIVLEAGQGILFPSLYWHGVLYEEPSLSVSLRFERCPGGRPFAVLPRSWLLQRLVWLFFRQGYGVDADGFLLEYMSQFFDRKGGWKQRYNRIADLCKRALLERGERKGAEILVANNFSAELALASQELRFYYQNAKGAGAAHADEIVAEVSDYLFEGMKDVPFDLGMELARHALRVRQGLPPRRGLVTIEKE
jgi:hypothetical protein